MLVIEDNRCACPQDMPEDAPMSAAQRDVFYRHPTYVPKAGLTDEQVQQFRELEVQRAEREAQAR